jgi:hypothetical protein
VAVKRVGLNQTADGLSDAFEHLVYSNCFGALMP